MKTILALQLATLLSVSVTSIAATVDYEHPNLTIVAEDEPLDSVLKSLGKEMRIYIVVPAGLNPVVSCDTSPESWLNQQIQYDLWVARQASPKMKVQKLYAA